MVSIPSSMTAIEVAAPGGPEQLVTTIRPVPQPAAGEVLIRVAGAGINRADTLQRMGLYPMPPGATDIPGLECSGVVVALGEGTQRWQVGDRVCALLSGGGYAEYVTVPGVQCLPIPANVDLVEAGGLPETFCTVWTNVFERSSLKAGEVFMIQGGTSGIGFTAIQLAKAFGASVLATAGSDEKCDACVSFGADRAINYKAEDFVKVGMDFTDGRLCFVALMEGPIASHVDFGLVHRKHLTVTGSTLRSRTVEAKGAICAAVEEKCWPLFGTGAAWPVTYKRFSLAEAAQSHELMESSQHIGKILLTTGFEG